MSQREPSPSSPWNEKNRPHRSKKNRPHRSNSLLERKEPSLSFHLSFHYRSMQHPYQPICENASSGCCSRYRFHLEKALLKAEVGSGNTMLVSIFQKMFR